MLESRRVTSDEDLQEFRLEGKSLAFLVISAIVVAVVVFLCGVMVGRGVRSRGIDPVEVATSALDPTAAASLLDEIPEPTGTASGNTASPDVELTYASRLSGSSAPDALEEPLAPSRPSRPELPPVVTAVAQKPEPALRAPAGKGFIVQVMSVNQLRVAEDVARRLKAKGYPTFVSESGGMYRVRVGTFGRREEADAAATRLQKEENFGTPWITDK
jgi:cell division septation protein DedD